MFVKSNVRGREGREEDNDGDNDKAQALCTLRWHCGGSATPHWRYDVIEVSLTYSAPYDLQSHIMHGPYRHLPSPHIPVW